MNDLTVPTGKLSDIVRADAKIAMPEVVSVFISKYENELYDRKAALSESVAQHNKDLGVHEALVIEAADFSKYDGIKVPALNVISVLKDEITVDWDDEEIDATVTFHNIDKDLVLRRDHQTGFSKKFTSPISKQHLKTREKILKDITDETSQLTVILSKIGDMSRKERQVKARISEMRLEEQGLEGFLQDSEMLKLIKID